MSFLNVDIDKVCSLLEFLGDPIKFGKAVHKRGSGAAAKVEDGRPTHVGLEESRHAGLSQGGEVQQWSIGIGLACRKGII